MALDAYQIALGTFALNAIQTGVMLYPYYERYRARTANDVAERPQAVGDTVTSRIAALPRPQVAKVSERIRIAIIVVTFVLTSSGIAYLWWHTTQSVAILNVTDSDSPWPIPTGNNQIFAASGKDRDTLLILPKATGSGDVHTIKRIDKNSHVLTITPRGSDAIDGTNASVSFSVPQSSASYVDRASGQWATE